MTRFTCFRDEELDIIKSAFYIALDNMRLDTSQQRLNSLADEVLAEIKLRKKEKKDSVNGLLDFGKQDKIKELHEDLVSLIRKEIEASNSHYGIASSCEDDEKLVVLCMINKQLKDMCETLEGMQETLARIDDKI